MALARAIAGGDAAATSLMLAGSPSLAQARFETGATRQDPNTCYIQDIGHYCYAGHTALHVAAAAYRTEIACALIDTGANVRARNRRGAEPLHCAAVGRPDSPGWDPAAQAAMIACLIHAGADPNAADKSGVTPLHRAVRTRCAAAVSALLERGADVRARNGSGSTAMLLAIHNTGRSGSGSPEARAQQRDILRLLEQHGATRT